MALIGKACPESNLSDGERRPSELFTGPLQSQVPLVFARCAAKVFTKCLHKINRMHASYLSQRSGIEWLEHSIMDELLYSLHPGRDCFGFLS